MRYDVIKNPNYVATVIRVAALADLEGLDNLKALQVFGMQALVGKDVLIGDLGVLFSTEVQLASEYAAANNLHRHTNLNHDPTQAGYLEDSRRVKAIRLRGHRSDSLFMPLESFAYLNVKPTDFAAGDTFDSINGKEILRKYQIKTPGINKVPQARVRRVDLKVFPLHIDSENYWRNSDKIPARAPVVVTQKLHGTSARYGRVPVVDKMGWFRRLRRRLAGVTGDTYSYLFVVGSRMVVKSIDNEAESVGKQHFYAHDLWSEYANDRKLADLIPDGYLVYGEIVGWTKEGAPLQKNYTYDQQPGTAELYVYRVATVTPSGVVTDLSWPATKAFAHGIGLKTVPEMETTMHEEFTVNDWIDRRYYAERMRVVRTDAETLGVLLTSKYDRPIRLSDEDTVDEGVCVRYDGPNGIYILKAKSPIFLGHESRLLDTGEEDIESEESL